MEKIGPRTIDFSGIRWDIRSWPTPVGPQLNNWSDSPENVTVDDQGRLHLKILKGSNGDWQSSEVLTQNLLGYGEYTFYLDSDIDSFDPYVVIGLFSSNLLEEPNINEIDIEITTDFGGIVHHPRKIFHTVHLPISAQIPDGRLEDRFDMTQPQYDPSLGTKTTHRFDWQPDQIIWSAFYGHDPNPASLIKGAVTCYDKTEQPVPGKSKLHLNFWLVNPGYTQTQRPPSGPLDQKDAELIIKRFEFR